MCLSTSVTLCRLRFILCLAFYSRSLTTGTARPGVFPTGFSLWLREIFQQKKNVAFVGWPLNIYNSPWVLVTQLSLSSPGFEGLWLALPWAFGHPFMILSLLHFHPQISPPVNSLMLTLCVECVTCPLPEPCVIPLVWSPHCHGPIYTLVPLLSTMFSYLLIVSIATTTTTESSGLLHARVNA